MYICTVRYSRLRTYLLIAEHSKEWIAAVAAVVPAVLLLRQLHIKTYVKQLYT